MSTDLDEFSLWIAPDDSRLTFRGRLLGSAQRIERSSGMTAEARVYRVASGGYVVSLSQLSPEETIGDDLARRREMKASYGHAWPRSTVDYAAWFPDLETLEDAYHDGFADRSSGLALDAALAEAKKGLAT